MGGDAKYDENGDRLPEYYGIRAAGRKVHRSRWTIQRWEKAGMRVQIIDGRKLIELQDLQAMYRQKIRNARENRKRMREKVAGSEKLSKEVDDNY